MGNPFYAQLVAGIEAAAESSSLAVISGSSGNREQRERLYLSLFEEQRVRGILLASTGGASELIEAIRGRGTPVVLVERERDAAGGSSVSRSEERRVGQEGRVLWGHGRAVQVGCR